jgi:hypothetical protein
LEFLKRYTELLMTTFAFKSKFSKCPDAEIVVGQYPNGSTAWQVVGDCGEGYQETITTPTVALGMLPPEGCVFIKITDDFSGVLDSLVRANIVVDTGERKSSGWVDDYAAVCRVNDSSLLAT